MQQGDGVVEYVDANEICIKYKMSDEDKLLSFEDELKTYQLTKFKKNKSKYLHQS